MTVSYLGNQNHVYFSYNKHQQESRQLQNLNKIYQCVSLETVSNPISGTVINAQKDLYVQS